MLSLVIALEHLNLNLDGLKFIFRFVKAAANLEERLLIFVHIQTIKRISTYL